MRSDTSVLVFEHEFRDRVDWPAANYPRILVHVPVAELDHGIISMEDILLPIILTSPLEVASDGDCWIEGSILKLIPRVQLKACTGRENLQ